MPARNLPERKNVMHRRRTDGSTHTPATHPAQPNSVSRIGFISIAAFLTLTLGFTAQNAAAQIRVPANQDRSTTRETPRENQPRQQTGNPNQPSGAATEGAGGVVFADEPLTLASIGMRILIPINARTQAEQLGDRVVARIIPDDQTWLIALDTRKSENPEVGPMQAMDASIEGLREQFGSRHIRGRGQNIQDLGLADSATELIERRPGLVIGGMPAARFYMRIATDVDRILVRGYTFLQPRPGEFVVLEMACANDQFERVRQIYETVVATTTFRSPEAFLMDRAVAVRSGIELLNRITPNDIRRVMPKQQIWYRLYEPGGTGVNTDDTEAGYRGIRFWEGQRGEIDPAKRQAQFRGVERDEGFIVEVKGRTLDQLGMIDFAGRFFMTPDRRSEAWLVTTVIRDSTSKEIGRATETGARTDNAMQIAVEIPGRENSVVQPKIEGEGYLCAVEAMLLPNLLADAGIAGEFGFYTYRSNTESITLRRDRVERADAPPGSWRISSRYGEADEQQVTHVGPNNQVRSTVLPDGRRWEPIELVQLERLWRNKGLPVTTQGR